MIKLLYMYGLQLLLIFLKQNSSITLNLKKMWSSLSSYFYFIIPALAIICFLFTYCLSFFFILLNVKCNITKLTQYSRKYSIEKTNCRII